MSAQTKYDAMFSGVIGQEYHALSLICPLAAQMSGVVGEAVRQYSQSHSYHLQVVELGGGTGITTTTILSASDNLTLLSVDNEPVMQSQAKNNLQHWQNRVSFCADDALSALQKLASDSVDIVASAYTIHNFLDSYRAKVIREIFRVLKSGGQFINGDRYGLDDISAHTLMIQNEMAGYFKVFTEQKRLDLLEQWILHLFSDESENHVMRESFSLQQLKEAGFVDIQLSHRAEVNALVTAVKF
jgi:ubiquinone/menaquinone biosynthesis C-methylase UbiE